MIDCLIIGGGPAGLMAADMVSAAGHSVQVIDQKPSLGRKFLMAGKSGLNLTKDEAMADFLDAYWRMPGILRDAISNFGPDDIQSFARDLGQDLFTGSTGRVFPKVMKASPMLRAWIARLTDQGVTFQLNNRWAGFEDGHVLDGPNGREFVHANTVIFAMGGGSWARLGSDGIWREKIDALGHKTAPFLPSNAGLIVPWSRFMEPQFGQPIKAVAWSAGKARSLGEAVISARGLEGGAIYALGAELREGAALKIDLFPKMQTSDLQAWLDKIPAKESRANMLRKLGLDAPKRALVNEFARDVPKPELVTPLKALTIAY